MTATTHHGILPGAIGRIIERHATYCSALAGFDGFFEAKVAREPAGFCERYADTRDGLWLAIRNDRIEGAIAFLRRSHSIAPKKQTGARLRRRPGIAHRLRLRRAASHAILASCLISSSSCRRPASIASLRQSGERAACPWRCGCAAWAPAGPPRSARNSSAVRGRAAWRCWVWPAGCAMIWRSGIS